MTADMSGYCGTSASATKTSRTGARVVFTALAMSAVFFFLADPVAVLRECRRVLEPGARVAIFTTGPELVGTPAAPEPIASHGHFYGDAQLGLLGRAPDCGRWRSPTTAADSC